MSQDPKTAPNNETAEPGHWFHSLQVRHPATVETVLAVAVAGVAFDLMARNGAVGIGGALFCVVTAAVLAFVVQPPRNRWTTLTLVAAALFGLCLALRSSPWLVPFNVFTTFTLLWLASSFASGGSPFRLTVPGFLVRSIVGLTDSLMAIPFILAPIRKATANVGGPNLRPVLRGIAIIAPIIVILALLLASADPVFASAFDLDFNAGELVSHVVLFLFGSLLVAALVRIARAEPAPIPTQSRKPLGAVEGLIAVGALVFLFAAFAVSQIVVFAGGADEVLKTAGLSYAEHAREGFFQLLAVAAITLGVLMAVRSITSLPSRREARLFKFFAVAAVVLTLVIVAVALRRLALYESVYGLTMLRLFSSVFAVWIGIVFVLLAVKILEVRKGEWFLGASASVAMVGLLALNIANPEALVVKRNDARQGQAGVSVPFDTYYNSSLSPDSVPALVAAANQLSVEEQDVVKNRLCVRDSDSVDERNWLQWNWSKHRADQALKKYCS